MQSGGQAAADRIAAVRRFNRFYTRQVGALREGLLGSPFSLTEARVLFELNHRESCTASQLVRDLDLDPGYLSRILQRFENKGLVQRSALPSDARQSVVTVTSSGRAAFAPLDKGSKEEIGAILARLSEPQQRRLVAAMRTVEDILSAPPHSRPPYVLRCHRPGDMGYVVHRQAVLYAEEWGWDDTFEALVAEIVAKFLREFDERRERCWIAEIDGEIVGSVFVVKSSDKVAQLRLLYVEPAARGLGIGRHLVDECIRFARSAGYDTLMLWTNDILVSARRIYQAAGFRLVREEKHRSFGHDLVGQYWDLDLRTKAPAASPSAPPSTGEKRGTQPERG
jgi:DNA-binding MarR family transcriptional regulator/GNAT superfamily N-acetyltransferase